MNGIDLIFYSSLVFCAGGLIGCLATELEMIKSGKSRIVKKSEER